MADTKITISFDGAPAVVAQLNDLKKAAGKAAADAFKALAAEARRVTAEVGHLNSLLATSNSQLSGYAQTHRAVGLVAADAARQLHELGGAAIEAGKAQAALRTLGQAHAKAGQSARLQSEDVKGLFNALGSWASALAAGEKPVEVLLEKGAELAGIWRSSGLTFGDFARESGVALGILQRMPAVLAPATAGAAELGATMAAGSVALTPLGAALGVLAVGAAAAFGGAALAARALNKENGDLTVGMGLTEEQLQRLKDQGVDTGVTIGDVFQGAYSFIRDAVEPALAPVRASFSSLLDGVTEGSTTAVKWLVGGFAGAFAAIKATWTLLPAAIGDMAIIAANLALRALDDLVNRAVDLINPLIDKANAAAKALRLPVELDRLSHVNFGEIHNPYAGQAAAIPAAAQEAFNDAFRRSSAGIEKIFKDLGATILQAGRTRIGKSVSDAETAKKTGSAPDAKRYSEEVRKGCTCPAPTSGAATSAATSRPSTGAPGGIELVEPFAADGLKTTEELTRPVREALVGATKSVRETFQEAADAVTSFKTAIKQQDWQSAFNSLRQTFGVIREAFARGPVTGITSLAGAVGSVVGGKTGQALAGGMGIATMGASLGNFLAAGEFAAAAANGAMALGGSVGFAAGLGNGIMALGSALGPIALAAGALYAVAKIAGIGGKPSNHAAIAQITGDSFRMISTGKETQETTQAASSAADAIVKAQGAFAAAGISLASTVTKIDLGTRDRTHIFLSSGEELRSAKGDAGAAVDTALRAVLQGATYVSDAQKTLVESALAAGGGFDKVVEKLNAYAEAQKLPAQLDRAILKLSDPKAYALAELEGGQQARRDSAQALADAGYLTAVQLESINGQLATLEGLELADTLKQFSEAVEDTTDKLGRQRRSLEADLAEAMGDGEGARSIRRRLSLEDLDPGLRDLQAQVWTVQDAAAAVETAHADLAAAYERESAAYKATIDKFQQFAGALREFRDSLSTEGLSAGATASVLRGRLISTVSAARAGDEAAFQALPGLGRDYLDAAKSQARSAAEYADEVSFVRAATEEAERYAQSQVSVAELQLQTLNQQVGATLMVNDSVQSVAAALGAYQQALATLNRAKTDAQAVASGTLTDAQAARYLEQNRDLTSNWNAGGEMVGLAPTLLEAAKRHYELQGRFEIASGTRRALAFATGGSFEVGGAPGVDQNLIPLRLTRGEVVNIRRPGTANDNSAVVGAVQRLEARLGDMADALVAANSKLASLEKLNRKWDGDGMPQTRNTGTQ